MATHDKSLDGELPAPAGGLGRGLGIALGKGAKNLHLVKSVRGFLGPMSSTLGRAISYIVRGEADFGEGD